jgi:hypothetical protein
MIKRVCRIIVDAREYEITIFKKKGIKMKVKISIVLLFLLAIPLTTEANFSRYVGVGLTRATLRNEGGKSEWGKFFGLGLEYTAPFSLYIATEAAYATEKATLENKSWPSDSEIHNSGKSIGNIPIHGSFLELAMKIGYNFQVFENQFTFKLYAGPIMGLQLHYLGSFKETIHLWYDPEKGPYEFDYQRHDSEGDPRWMINAVTGVILSYKAFGIEASYTRALVKRNYMICLSLNEELDSLHFILRYTF